MCRVSLCSMFAIKFQLQPWFKFYSLLFLMAGDMFWPDLWVVLTIHWRWHHGGGNLLSIIITAASYHCDQLTGDQWPSDLANTCYPDPGPSWWHLGDRWHLLTLTHTTLRWKLFIICTNISKPHSFSKCWNWKLVTVLMTAFVCNLDKLVTGVVIMRAR